MRILMLPRYTRAGASSRVRMYDYLPALHAAGCEVEVAPLLDDAYVQALYAGRRAPASVLRGYLRRVASIWRARRFDVVWLEKELLPWLPATIEQLIWPRAKVIVDYDDAVFHRYDRHPSGLVRRVLGRKIDAVMRRADLVTAGNAYLAERALAAGCTRVERVPTVVDLAHYQQTPTPSPRNDGTVTIGWIGSPATADYLRLIAPVLEQLGQVQAIRCVAVGARADQVADTPFEAVPWSEDTEAAQISGFDIGVMPLFDTPWERGKCGYKLIQYMACGVPVIASPIGVNQEIVAHGVNGFLAGSPDEWKHALATLMADPGLRTRMGAAGRCKAEAEYSLQAWGAKVAALVSALGN